jgi:hypothetical protein
VHIAWWAFIVVGNGRQGYDGAVGGEQELEVETVRIGVPAPEAAVLRGMDQRGKAVFGLGQILDKVQSPLGISEEECGT